VRKIQALEIRRIWPGHHQLDISVHLVNQIEAAFEELAGRNLLKQGAGIFSFDGFQIHI